MSCKVQMYTGQMMLVREDQEHVRARIDEAGDDGWVALTLVAAPFPDEPTNIRAKSIEVYGNASEEAEEWFIQVNTMNVMQQLDPHPGKLLAEAQARIAEFLTSEDDDDAQG